MARETVNRDAPASPTLSIHRSFVVQFYADIDPVGRRICGRVEHVVSREGSEFRSVEDLLEFIGRVLGPELA